MPPHKCAAALHLLHHSSPLLFPTMKRRSEVAFRRISRRYMRVWELLRRGACTALEVAKTWDVVAREERGQLRHRAMVASRLSAG
ncbi:hypothetical protein V6Z11_D11G177100 [Gossypium hirsutum]